MKKYVLILAAALAFAACQKEAAVKDEPVNEELNTFTFTAVVDDNVVDADTKATVSRGGVFAWAVNDALAFYDTAGTKYNAVVTAVDGSGVATIEVTAAGTPTFYSAIYPAAVAAGKNQIQLYGAAKGPVVIAEVGSGELTFHHMGSIVNIKINDIPAGTQTMQIVPKAAISWTGGSFTFNAGVPDFSGASVPFCPVVPVTAADSGTDISVPMLSANYTGGFEIFLMNNEGRNLYRKATTKSYDLTGTKLLNMKALTYEGPSVYYLKTVAAAGKPDFWSQEDMPLIRTGENTYSITANVDRMSTYYIYDEWNMDEPTTHYLATGSTTTDTYTASTFTIIGECNSWALADNATYTLNKIGDWNYIIGAEGLHNTKFKFNPIGNTSDWKQPWGFDGVDAAWFNTASTNTLSMAQNRADTGLWVDGGSDKPVDFYLNTSAASGQCYLSGYKGNPLCSVAQFDLDITDPSDITVTIQSQANVKPFANATFPTDAFALVGQVSSWGDTTTGAMTYDGNMSWVGEITPSGTSLAFKLVKTDQSGYWAGQKTGFGANLYGDVVGDAASNSSITLESGKTYKVYVNATTSWIYNIMFVKQ